MLDRRKGARSAALVLTVVWLAASPAVAQLAPQQQTMPQRADCPPGQPCTVRAPQFGLRCLTPRFVCGLPQPGPLGSNCFCNTPTGAVSGRVAL
jgi:hypothetical protein